MIHFSIIIPIYNESNNIFRLLEEINEQDLDKYNFEILIINDASTDDFLLKFKNFKLIQNIKLINLDKNMGQSNAINVGIRSSKYNNIITIDGDGQNNPADIKNLIDSYESNKNLSLVAGIRKARKDKFSKRIASIIANKVRMLYLGDKCIDTGCSLKIFKKDIFFKFEFFDGIHRFIPSMFEGIGCAVLYKYVSHRERKYGNSNYDNFKRMYRGIVDMIYVKKQINKLKL